MTNILKHCVIQLTAQARPTKMYRLKQEQGQSVSILGVIKFQGTTVRPENKMHRLQPAV